MSSVWTTTVLPSLATGVVTFLITRTSDKRKFRNDLRLQAMSERRQLYAEFYAVLDKYEKAVLDALGGLTKRQRIGRVQEAYESLEKLRPRFEVETPRKVYEAYETLASVTVRIAKFMQPRRKRLDTGQWVRTPSS